jgi:excisionase family DNA binding protein
VVGALAVKRISMQLAILHGSWRAMAATNGWLSSRESAERLGVSLRTLYKLIDEGRLVGYQIGRNIRLREQDIEEFLDRSRIAPGGLKHLYQFDDEDSEEVPGHLGGVSPMIKGAEG